MCLARCARACCVSMMTCVLEVHLRVCLLKVHVRVSVFEAACSCVYVGAEVRGRCVFVCVSVCFWSKIMLVVSPPRRSSFALVFVVGKERPDERVNPCRWALST